MLSSYFAVAAPPLPTDGSGGPDPPHPPAAGPARREPAEALPAGGLAGRSRLLLQALYLLTAVMLAGLYFGMTAPWSPAHFDSYVRGTMQYPQALDPFRFRVLMPAVGGALSRWTGIAPIWIFRVLAGLGFWAILLAYRGYLRTFVEPRAATWLGLAIAYPLLWNFCLLNRLYFPFDVPAVLFAVLGCLWIRQRRWLLYYPLLVIATLNRETSLALILIFFTGLWGELPAGRLAAHLAAQLALWTGILLGLRRALGGGNDLLSTGWLAWNAGVLRDMLTLRGHALKDWAKLALAFGGAWWVAAATIRRQPAFVRRSLLSVIPFVLATAFRGILDEVRLYGELIPVVVTPAVLALAEALPGARPAHSSTRPPGAAPA